MFSWKKFFKKKYKIMHIWVLLAKTDQALWTQPRTVAIPTPNSRLVCVEFRLKIQLSSLYVQVNFLTFVSFFVEIFLLFIFTKLRSECVQFYHNILTNFCSVFNRRKMLWILNIIQIWCCTLLKAVESLIVGLFEKIFLQKY